MVHKHKKHSFWDKIVRLVANEDISVAEICNEENLRHSVAALLILVATADDDFTQEEYTAIKTLLTEEFDLPDNLIDELIKDAQDKTENSIDLYNFVRIINQNLDQEGRQDIVRMLWRVVFADKTIQNLEDNIMRKLCHLLGIDRLDYVELKNEIYESTIS